MQNLLTLHYPQSARNHNLAGIWQQETLYTLARRHARERRQGNDCPALPAGAYPFPLTASAKILKRDLVEMTRRGELAPMPVNFKDFVPTGD
jgi:hypothetical protein